MIKETSRIAFFIENLHGGGAEKVTVDLVNSLNDRSYNVDLICQSYEGAYVKNINPSVNILVVGSNAPLRGIQFLRKYLKREKPEVLFTVLEKPSLLALVSAIWTRYRNVVPCVHINLDSYASLDHKVRRKLLRFLVGVFYRRAARVTVVSQGAADALRRAIGPAVPIDVVYNGFDLRSLQRQSQEEIHFPFLADGAPVFIACGRMVPQKGFDTLIRAFAKIQKETNSRLIILGEGPLREMLTSLGKTLGVAEYMHMPGFVANPTAWFICCDVFVLSSRLEGFGNVLVEALASGLEIVSADCPSGPAEILQSGTYGKLVPVDDIDAMAEAMKAALLHRRSHDKINVSVTAYLEKNYAMETMVDGYVRVIQSLTE